MTNEEKWMINFELARKYYYENGNLFVDKNYVVDGVRLGEWLHNQIKKYEINKLKLNRKLLLESIGIKWDKTKKDFSNIVLLKKSKEIPHYEINLGKLREYVSKNGSIFKLRQYDNLYKWIQYQLLLYKAGVLSNKQFYELKELEIPFEVMTKPMKMWDDMYNSLINDLLSYKKVDMKNLKWLETQIELYKTNDLSLDKIKILKISGFIPNDDIYDNIINNYIISLFSGIEDEILFKKIILKYRELLLMRKNEKNNKIIK